MAISMTMIVAMVLIAGLAVGVNLIRRARTGVCTKCGRKCSTPCHFCPTCGGEIR